MYEPVEVKDFKAGDLVRCNPWSTDRDHEIVSVNYPYIQYRHAFYPRGGIIHGSIYEFGGYRWFKKIAELKYDPSQQPDEEDDI